MMTGPDYLNIARQQLGEAVAALDDQGGGSWVIARDAWAAILSDREAASPFVRWTEDPAHPTLMGLPVTVKPDAVGVALHIGGKPFGPLCCGGGPQWGHKFDCPRCPD